MKTTQIGLLDCNNFFVSCERLFRPELENRPVVVLSSNDGCVVARSQEIKDMNVPMGVPYFKIKDILKKADAVAFSSHFALYRDISRRVFTVMREEVGAIEQYSIDEAFFRVSSDAENIANQLKKAVEKQVGIPVSVGIASTKTQTKYTNTLAKKGDGTKVMSREEWSDLSSKIPINHIWGVGGKMAKKYKEYNLNTVADVVKTERRIINNLFGVSGIRLQQELSGNSMFKVGEKIAPQQTILSSRSFKKTTENKDVLADAIAHHIRHAMANLRSMNMETTSIRVAIRPSSHGDFLLRGGSKEAVLSIPTSDTIEALKVANKLVNELYESNVQYKKAGVTLSNLQPFGINQGLLFPESTHSDKDSLMKVVDNLNKQNNKEVVLLGSRLIGSSWWSRSEVKSPAYTTRWSEVVKVKAT